jgi:flavin prenyltransferase
MIGFPRIVVGIIGASGIAYGHRFLTALRTQEVETHLIVSRAACQTIAYEADWTLEDLHALADVVHPVSNIGASIGSGSFKTTGMVIIPCSIRTLSEIVTGVTSSLMTRAADVILKERRRLVLVVRETPLHSGHLRTMLAASELGAIIAPPMPAMYTRPTSVDDIINHTVGRTLDLFGLETDLVRRWGEELPQLEPKASDKSPQFP